MTLLGPKRLEAPIVEDQQRDAAERAHQAGVAAVMAVLSARYGFGQKGEYLYFGLMGAIPAALCSWLSDKPMRSVNE